MNKTNLLAGLLGGVALVVALLGFFRPLVVDVQPANVVVGGSSGTEHTNAENFLNGVGYGPRLDLLTFETRSLTASEVCDNSVITGVPGVEFASITLPTASTLINNCLPEAGMTKQITFLNLGTGALSSTAFASNTGVILRTQVTSGTAVTLPSETQASSTAIITIVNVGSSTLHALLQKFRAF